VLAAQRDAAARDQISYWDAGWPGYRWTELGMSWGSSGLAPSDLWQLSSGNLLGVAMYEATVAAWDSKYAYNRPRPNQTEPTLATAVATPASPSYPSSMPSWRSRCDRARLSHATGCPVLHGAGRGGCTVTRPRGCQYQVT
jgi:hypothetical protein